MTEERITAEQSCMDLPKPDDSDYVKKVLCIGRSEIDLDNKEKTKAELYKEIDTCRLLMGAWSDGDKVVEDCEAFLKSAQDTLKDAGKDASKIDVDKLVLANDQLLRVRERLVQAWYSRHSTKSVICLAIWQLVWLIAIVSVLVCLKLLPGEKPVVFSSNVNAAILVSAFLFGAIGGLFDGISALSKHYSDYKFDPTYWFWYVVNFILGGILGFFACAAILAGFVTIAGNSNSSDSQTIPATLALVVAFIAGVKQIKVLDLLERIADAVFSKDTKSTKSKSSS